VYVTGYSHGISTGYDYATVKYNTQGVQQWVRRFDGPGTSDDFPYALKVDSSGNVLVTGDAFFEIDHGSDYGTVKYSPSGVEQWVGRYNGPGNATDIAFALAIDEADNVYVTGGSRGADLADDFATIKYSASGAEVWCVRSESEDETYDLAAGIGIDGSGAVYVTGSSTRLGGRLWTTVKYAEGTAVSADEAEEDVREGYALELAGPNPFRQRVAIRYSVGAKGHSRLRIFDVRGAEVATLVDEIRDPGSGRVEWDAAGIPNGIYFLRLQAGDFVETKKVVLLR
jgi:hypothetical protein